MHLEATLAKNGDIILGADGVPVVTLSADVLRLIEGMRHVPASPAGDHYQYQYRPVLVRNNYTYQGSVSHDYTKGVSPA